MNKQIGYRFLSLIITIMIVQESFSQSLDTLPLDNRQTVLNGKAYVDIPKSMKYEAREANIMSADYNINEETRFVLDIGKMRLVLFATELYTIANDKFLQTTENEHTKILSKKDSLFSIMTIPQRVESGKQAILISSLFVKTSDNTLFRFDAYLNSQGFEYMKDFQALAERIFATIKDGERNNVLSKRIESFPSYINDQYNFVFEIPDNYFVTVDRKYDFEVFKVKKFVPYSEQAVLEQLIIYTGFYPSNIYEDFNLSEQDAKKVKGKLFNQNINWLQFEIKSQSMIVREQKISNDEIQEGLKIHVAMLCSEVECINNLSKMVENIRIEK